MNKVARFDYYLRLETCSTCFLKILAVPERQLKTLVLSVTCIYGRFPICKGHLILSVSAQIYILRYVRIRLVVCVYVSVHANSLL
jgi:hypothetical protein